MAAVDSQHGLLDGLRDNKPFTSKATHQVCIRNARAPPGHIFDFALVPASGVKLCLEKLQTLCFVMDELVVIAKGKEGVSEVKVCDATSGKVGLLSENAFVQKIHLIIPPSQRTAVETPGRSQLCVRGRILPVSLDWC